MRNIIAVLLSTLLLAPSWSMAETDSIVPVSVQAPSVSAIDEVRRTIDELVAVVEKYSGASNIEARRAKLREVLNRVFDFSEMSKRSLGTNWKEVSPSEQEEFVSVFSDLLARTYLSKIETIKPGMVHFDGEKVELPRATVKTRVEDKGDFFPIDYKLLVEEGHWKVYDVVIENIGLVANYRNEFAGIIRRETFAGLLKRLREKQSE
ncbi:MAG: ABC transporter substrate-binding protein [Oligoflexia bacterium]|nr:ABC transporter substrate-binding protein [Oligoflexia bacterium]